MVQHVIDFRQGGSDAVHRTTELNERHERCQEARHQNLQRDQTADAQLTIEHGEGPDSDDGRGGQHGQQVWNGAQHGCHPQQRLTRVDHLRVEGGESVEGLILGARGLNELDIPQRGSGLPNECPLLLQEQLLGLPLSA